ncbi:MAG TPA: glucose-6-phosphate isomerase [Dehalococcoidia bacterium]|nr:glucose-6-phosphate isomerase [Dehalococcoidia bacterium]
MPETATRPHALQEVVADLERRQVTRKLFDRDGSAWSDDPAEQAEIARWLGWLPVVDEMQAQVGALHEFAREVVSDGVEHVVLLGMGGSSLAPIVFDGVFGAAPEFPRLIVIDTTDPEAIRRADEALDPEKSLFVVSSKSGSTIEPNVLADYFWQRAGKDGRRFVAITDKDTSLSKLAGQRAYRRVFTNRSDIGGRYSALSYFGLVPAALIGVDVGALLQSATNAISKTRGALDKDNQGAWLGAQLAAFAKEGRDKITFVVAPELASLGLWLEQLIAESTGKRGTGLIPVAREELGEPSVYGDDRVFVSIEINGQPLQDAARLTELGAAGHPVIVHTLGDVDSLGAEMVNWEVATAVASSALGLNPFNQPNVQESKDNTSQLLEQLESAGALPVLRDAVRHGALTIYGAKTEDPVQALNDVFSTLKAGSYMALMAYLAETPERQIRLDRLRLMIRDRTHVATTFGYGPRFLHSTGQLHKGGPANAAFLQLTATAGEDLSIPGRRFTFGQLKAAQALGDFDALKSRGRPILSIDLGEDVEEALEELIGLCEEALGS